MKDIGFFSSLSDEQLNKAVEDLNKFNDTAIIPVGILTDARDTYNKEFKTTQGVSLMEKALLYEVMKRWKNAYDESMKGSGYRYACEYCSHMVYTSSESNEKVCDVFGEEPPVEYAWYDENYHGCLCSEEQLQHVIKKDNEAWIKEADGFNKYVNANN